jgi:hypothetical protein
MNMTIEAKNEFHVKMQFKSLSTNVLKFSRNRIVSAFKNSCLGIIRINVVSIDERKN